MDEEILRNSFQKIKEEMDALRNEIAEIREDMHFLAREMVSILEETSFAEEKSSFSTPTQKGFFSTNNSFIPTDNPPFKPLKTRNLRISIGNGGVPTDRQTDRQTDTYSQNNSKNNENPFENALEILNSMDSAKKEIRLKFKKITDQEFLVFSTIYQMEDEGNSPDYRTLSEKLGLTESSIRDYVGKLIRKGIPLNKNKVNNKQVILSVSPSLRNTVSLSAILQLKHL